MHASLLSAELLYTNSKIALILKNYTKKRQQQKLQFSYILLNVFVRIYYIFIY